MEKEQRSLKSQDGVSKVATVSHIQVVPQLFFHIIQHRLFLSGPESLRNFRVTEGRKFMITILPKGNLNSQIGEAEQSK